MSKLEERLSAWSRWLRRAAYLFGFAGMVMMLVARGGDATGADPVWSRRAMLCLGLMMATFAAYYVLAMLRINRR